VAAGRTARRRLITATEHSTLSASLQAYNLSILQAAPLQPGRAAGLRRLPVEKIKTKRPDNPDFLLDNQADRRENATIWLRANKPRPAEPSFRMGRVPQAVCRYAMIRSCSERADRHQTAWADDVALVG
jgi:hypothetical protein